VLAGIPLLPEPVRAADVTYPCLGAPAGEPAGGAYPEPRIFFESQSWWTETGEVFPGRHIHTGACIPWLQPVDGVVQFHVRNLLHGMPGTVKQFRLQIWNNGPDPALALPLVRSCETHDCTFWDSFTVDYAGRLPGRWEHRFTHNIEPNVFGQRQFTTTRWHICVRTCVGGTTEAYTRAAGAAGWYQGLDYANAYLDPDDYARLRAGVAPGVHRIKIKFDPGIGSLTVDPDAHNGNPGIVQRRASDGLLLGGFLPVTTGTAWFEAIVDTTGLSPGMHKLALRGSKANATGREEGVLLVPFIVTGTTPPPPPVAAFTASPVSGDAPLTVNLADTSSGGPTAWTWAFDDGTSDATGQAPGSHTYTTAGTYTLSLTVDNAVGPASTTTRTITVNTPPPPPPPNGRIKDITFDPTLLDPVHGVDKLSGTVTRETAAPLAGPGSARISNAAAYAEETISPTDDVFMTFRVRITGLPSGSPRLFMLSNVGTTQANLLLKPTGRLQLRVGSTNVGAESSALSTGTTYIVGIHQRRGTGGNAVVEAYVAPVGTAFGAPFAARTNGTWTTAADRLRIGGTNGSAVSVILDNVLIDRSAMPLAPLP
jgi:PKD repeat protein